MSSQYTISELAYTFLNITINDIRKSKETPNINFHFNDEDKVKLITMAKLVLELDAEGAQEYYDRFFGIDPSAKLTVEVNSFNRFFKALYYLALEQDNLNEFYDKKESISDTAVCLLRRIWLRMGPDDVNNVENFLNKQLEFIKNRRLDTLEPVKVDDLDDQPVFMKTVDNETWDETSRRMIFTVGEGREEYDLPTVLYDIDDSDVCYIFGVQNTNREPNSRIERKLYQLNKGIEDPNVHPSKVYSLLLFMNELKKHNITKVVVPTLQVLSYPYHEDLSYKSVLALKKSKFDAEVNANSLFHQDQYKNMQSWYGRVHDKQDKISYLKSEELANLVYRITLHDNDIEIMSDMEQSTDINVRINRRKV